MNGWRFRWEEEEEEEEEEEGMEQSISYGWRERGVNIRYSK